MSYCHFSTNNYKCDVWAYVYQNSCWVRLATHRIAGGVPKKDFSSPDTIYDSHKELAEFMDACMRVPIGLKYDGKLLKFETLTHMLHGLLDLAEMGYVVPQGVIDGILLDLEELDE